MPPICKSVFLCTCALAASTAAGVAYSSEVPSFSAPGIAVPGFPDFASLSFSAALEGSKASGYTLTLTGRDPSFGFFNVSSGGYLVRGEEVELTAHFDSTGHLLQSQPNTIEIFGSLPASKYPSFGKPAKGLSWSKQPFELLFEAVLTGVAVDSKHEALGFSTGDFSGWADQLQFTGSRNPSESLWLYSLSAEFARGAGASWDKFLAEIQNDKPLQDAHFYGIGSIATVPLPASGLLMLGGLAGLGMMGRRRRS